jgi:hypothetical protein
MIVKSNNSTLVLIQLHIRKCSGTIKAKILFFYRQILQIRDKMF